MFYVTSLDSSQVEPLINISNDFKMEQSVDGTFTVSFSVFPSQNNPGYDLLQLESMVTVEGNDFKVKRYKDNGLSKTVTAVSTFFEHSKTWRDGIFSGIHTLRNHLNFVLNGTGWAYMLDDTIANITNYLHNFGDDNVVSLVNKICKYHECEYVILPGNRLHFAKEVGPDHDHQYRYKHNISDVVLIEDSTNLFTFIRGYGADGLEVSYTSPNADVFGILEAEPINDDRFTDANSLGNYIKNTLKDVPELAIESNIPELTAREIGERVWLIYEPLNIEMQTRILQQMKSLVNGELITSSVVFGNAQIKSLEDLFVEQKQEINATNKVIGEAKDEYRSKFEQTDNRITLEVEQVNASIASVNIKADEIALSVNNRITNEVAAINIRTDSIEMTVQNNKDELSSSITQTASSIRSEVKDVKNGLQSSIEQTATSIRSEVSAVITNVNTLIESNNSIVTQLINTTKNNLSESIGVVAENLEITEANLSSSITQTAATIRSEMNAEIVAVNQSIDNTKMDVTAAYTSVIEQTAQSLRSDFNASTTTVSGNVQTVKNDVSSLQQTASSLQSTVSSQATSISNFNTSVGNHSSRISSAESKITQQANQISSKVSQTDFNGNTIASLINQTATTVSINASKINLVGAVNVLSDITGNLGTITAGTINVSTNMTVGATLQIGQDWQANLPKAIRFAGSSGSAGIAYNAGSLRISAVDRIKLNADYIDFEGTTTGITAVFG